MHLRRHSAKVRTLARAGFTLMELLVVVAILLVLAGTAILTYRTLFAESRIGIAKTMCVTLKGQLDKFAMSPLHPNYPDPGTGFEELVALGYLERTPLDPWGQPYRWGLFGEGVAQRVVVWSCGPDLIDNGGMPDDITSE